MATVVALELGSSSLKAYVENSRPEASANSSSSLVPSTSGQRQSKLRAASSLGPASANWQMCSGLLAAIRASFPTRTGPTSSCWLLRTRRAPQRASTPPA
eukprot:scaffold859_cov59-Phaeocystis_antarctica.AAC.5